MALFCVLDTETTGLDPHEQELIEVAYIVCDQNFKELRRDEFRIKPANIETASPRALQINGYDERTWKPKFKTHKTAMHHLYSDIKEYYEGDERFILVGQNVSFDDSFLRETFKREKLSYPFYDDTLDTIELARMWCERSGAHLDSLSLKSLCRLTGTVNKNAHNAMSDVEATLGVMRWLTRELKSLIEKS